MPSRDPAGSFTSGDLEGHFYLNVFQSPPQKNAVFPRHIQVWTVELQQTEQIISKCFKTEGSHGWRALSRTVTNALGQFRGVRVLKMSTALSFQSWCGRICYEYRCLIHASYQWDAQKPQPRLASVPSHLGCPLTVTRGVLKMHLDTKKKNSYNCIGGILNYQKKMHVKLHSRASCNGSLQRLVKVSERHWLQPIVSYLYCITTYLAK